MRPDSLLHPAVSRAKARDAIGLGLTLAAATGALLVGVTVVANWFRPGRILRRRWLRRAVAGWFAGIGLLILVSAIAAGAA